MSLAFHFKYIPFTAAVVTAAVGKGHQNRLQNITSRSFTETQKNKVRGVGHSSQLHTD